MHYYYTIAFNNTGEIAQAQVFTNFVSKGEKVPKTNFAADFRAEKSQEGLRRKRNDRRCPIKLGPRILKIVVFEARCYYNCTSYNTR